MPSFLYHVPSPCSTNITVTLPIFLSFLYGTSYSIWLRQFLASKFMLCMSTRMYRFFFLQKHFSPSNIKSVLNNSRTWFFFSIHHSIFFGTCFFLPSCLLFCWDHHALQCLLSCARLCTGSCCANVINNARIPAHLRKWWTLYHRQPTLTWKSRRIDGGSSRFATESSICLIMGYM